MNLEKLSILSQYLAPQHVLSRLSGKLANMQHPTLTPWLIKHFVKLYGVNMQEALHEEIRSYADFHSFFIRELKPDARPIVSEANAIASPADGCISQFGNIRTGQLIQAKGREFSATELLGGSATLADPFLNGQFMTIYLSPKDYHRVHMPVDATLAEMYYVPGKLFSVSQATTRHVDRLFARNERVVCIFDTPNGKMAMVLVGAMMVASINTRWQGTIAPGTKPGVRHWRYPNPKTSTVKLSRGDEMGYFTFGSTVVLLFENERQLWLDSLSAGDVVKMGEQIGTV